MLAVSKVVDLLLGDEAKKFNVETRLFFQNLMDDDVAFTLFETDGGVALAEAKNVEDKVKLLFLAVKWQRNLSLVVGSKDRGYSDELPPVLIWGGSSFNQYYIDEALSE
jgi:hypothetical protein